MIFRSKCVVMYLFQYNQECPQVIDDRVYIHTLVVALSCVPTALWVGLTINMVGKKLMLGTWHELQY